MTYPWDYKIGDDVIYDYYGDESVKKIMSIRVNESETDQWGIPYYYATLDSGEEARTCFLKKKSN